MNTETTEVETSEPPKKANVEKIKNAAKSAVATVATDANPVVAEEATPAAAPAASAPEAKTIDAETPVEEEGGKIEGRGIRIIEMDGGKKKAIIPRNGVFFLNTTTKGDTAKRVTAETQKELGFADEVTNPDRVFESGPKVGALAFPGKASAKTLVQSTKSNLEERGVIKVLRSGSPAQPAIFELLVDEYEQKMGNQGVGGGQKREGQTRGRKKSVTTTDATTPARKTGRGPGRKRLLATQEQTVLDCIRSMPVKTVADAEAILNIVQQIENQGEIGKAILNLKVAA